jgi:ribosome assembly protein YihI (activator of Der GTPase)
VVSLSSQSNKTQNNQGKVEKKKLRIMYEGQPLEDETLLDFVVQWLQNRKKLLPIRKAGGFMGGSSQLSIGY